MINHSCPCSKDGDVYKVVEEEKRAWHAGKSNWGDRSALNDTSIGIEIVNTGDEPFSDAQVDAKNTAIQTCRTSNTSQNLALMKEKLIVGLTINPLRLTEIRKNRASVMQDNNELYSAQKNVLEEVENAKKFFAQNNWPIIDVTNRSVEEIAAEIIKEYNAKKRL